MTEFETASLGLQTAHLWALWGQVAATVVVGGAQCALIWYGIRAMRYASASRDKALDNQMLALKELIARTGGPAAAVAD